jgi:cytosine/adenosine deaminase-related metal-dependent hydrolase
MTPGTLVLENCHIATVDPAGREFPDGHLVAEQGRIVAVGPGPAPARPTAARPAPAQLIRGPGLLVTPGLVNTHHHLYQWITRGYATDGTLFGWLTALYPVWARLTADLLADAAAANLAWLALTGCTTSADHHYVFPAGAGDLLAAEIEAARRIGVRLHATRGSMNLGRSAGGLPPDSVVEPHDAVLAACQDAIETWHDPAPDAMTRIALAPCSPFSVTADLMRDCAALARSAGVRLHTHLAETRDEEDFCQQTFGRTPAQYAEDLGWLGPDVWLAHGVHLSGDAVARIAATGTAVAHCPTSNGRLGSGIAPVRALLDAGAAIGLGVDGSASNESGRMIDELHQALLAARYAAGPLALTVRDCLRMATVGGARCLGRDGELGSLQPGKLADVAVWRVDDLAGAGIADPVCTLVLGAPVLEHLFVGGRPVVAGRELRTADPATLAAAAARASARIAGSG